MRDPYEVLGLAEGASEDEVRAAYRRLTRQWHPDRFVGAPPEEQAAAAARFSEVTGAHQLLNDPAALARWRGHRRRTASGPPTPPPRTTQPPAETTSAPHDATAPAAGPFDYRAAAASEFFRSPADAPRTPDYGYAAQATGRRPPPPPPSSSRSTPPASRDGWSGRRLVATGLLVLVAVPMLTIGVIRLVTSDGAEAGIRTAVPRELGGARTVPASALSVGDCFDTAASERQDDGERTVWSTMPQPCTVAHESEVIALVQVGNELGEAYPGRSAIVTHAEPWCRGAYPEQVGAPFDPGTPLALHFVYPSPGSWADGDRLVVCAVASHDGAPLVGTARENTATSARS